MKNLMIALMALSLAACDPASTPETASAPAEPMTDVQQDVTPEVTDDLIVPTPDTNDRAQLVANVLKGHDGKWLLVKNGHSMDALNKVNGGAMDVSIDATHDCITIGGHGSPYNDEVTVELPTDIANPLVLVYPDGSGADTIEVQDDQMIWLMDGINGSGDSVTKYFVYNRLTDE